MKREKTPTYSEEDILGWESAYEESAARIVRKIRSGDVGDGHSLAGLARRHEYLGLTQIARGNYRKALGHFGCVAAARTNLLERHAAGQTIARELLDRTPPFTLAVAGGDEALIRRLADASAAVFVDAPSHNVELYYATMIMRALSLKDLETASQLVASFPEARKWPGAAVIDRDDASFAIHMRDFAELWKERVQSERLHRLPDAVCDHIEIGWIKLAERIWGRRPDVDLDAGKIPKGILEVEPEFIDPGI